MSLLPCVCAVIVKRGSISRLEHGMCTCIECYSMWRVVTEVLLKGRVVTESCKVPSRIAQWWVILLSSISYDDVYTTFDHRPSKKHMLENMYGL